MSRFAGKVALVTGASSGIGAAITQTLQDQGATVITAQRRNLPGGITADLADPQAPSQIIEKVITKTGRLDILINNAGVMEDATTGDTTLAMWERTLAVNLTAPFLLIKAALPHLEKTKGNIVNIGSISGLGSNPGHSAYGASKAGLHGLTRGVAVDCGPLGVRCNAVAPGWIDTDLNTAYIESLGDPDDFRAKIGGIHPAGRTGTATEVANLVAFLASEEAAFITGQVMTIDGGRMAKLSLP